MTEIIDAPEQSREELEAEIAALRDAARDNPVSADVVATRDRSPVKPQDHKPADGELVTVEYAGTAFTVRKGAMKKLVILDMLEQGLINTAMRRMVGDSTYGAFLEANPDANEETFSELFDLIAEAAGAKN